MDPPTIRAFLDRAVIRPDGHHHKLHDRPLVNRAVDQAELPRVATGQSMTGRAGGLLSGKTPGRRGARRGRLTEREREVLTLTAAGITDKEIAAHLGIGERTVRFHLSECQRRVGAVSRAHAIALAIELGEIETTTASISPPQSDEGKEEMRPLPLS